ncbi:unnamed protein product [Heterotrigona itama]|uniref:Kazal-like domain-containing protein n=1 Tax=Heterotrigona itama TaxID=395501 RepID=A0A6V7HFT1_9HYME|nr:unnamed protein product [Heterotrigona itama]
MFLFNSRNSHCLVFFFFFFFLVFSALVEIQIGSMQRDSDDDEGSKICQMEYQVTKKMPGKCFKLSRGITGCVSGDYVNPFHPDCF